MARAERAFTYQKRSREDLKERANMRGGNFDSFIKSKYKLYKVRDGKNLIRILPATWEKARHYGYDVFVNYGIGVDNQSYLSLSEMKKEADPLAEARKKAMRDGDKDLAKALQPRQRILMWIIDRNDEDEGPQLWAAPFTFDKDLANISLDQETREVIDIDDPEAGCDVRFFKEGQGLKTRYDASKMRLMKPSPVHEDEKLQEEWLEFVAANPVPDCLQFYDYEHIADAFDGQARVESSDDDDDSKTRKRASRDDDDDERPRRPRRPAEDDSADEKPRRVRAAPPPEDTDDDPPFEAEKPKARGRAAAATSVDTSDDEDPPTESIRDRLRRRRSAPATKSAGGDEED